MVRHTFPKNYERDPSHPYRPFEHEPMQDHSETYANYASATHVGKGPKNYRRSDDRIREEVCENLAQHPEIDATEIEVSVEDGTVILDGSVPDRRMKYFAEASIETIWGVDDIVNQIRVVRSPSPPLHSGAI